MRRGSFFTGVELNVIARGRIRIQAHTLTTDKRHGLSLSLPHGLPGAFAYRLKARLIQRSHDPDTQTGSVLGGQVSNGPEVAQARGRDAGGAGGG